MGQFKDFVEILAFRKMVEDWYISDFRSDATCERHEAEYGEKLTRTGSNLSEVAMYIYDNYPEIFSEIINKMKRYVPGFETVEVQEAQDGYIFLRFKDVHFQHPFLAKFVSDGTIKMFMYLILLHEPTRHSLLCVEKPENHLHPQVLEEFAEEFQRYSSSGQVFISTYSPDFLNAIPLHSIYCVEKKDGFAMITRASDNPRVQSLYDAGDVPGSLWRAGIMTGTTQ